MPLNGRTLWVTRNKIQRKGEIQGLQFLGDSPLILLLGTRGAIYPLANVRWFLWPGL